MFNIYPGKKINENIPMCKIYSPYTYAIFQFKKIRKIKNTFNKLGNKEILG